MATSGTISTTTFNNVKVIETAFRYNRVSPQKITAENLQTAKEQLYLMLSAWVNKSVPLWTIDNITPTMVAGVPTITLTVGTIDVFGVNYKVGDNETPLAAMSLDTYKALPNKLGTGRPTMYWLNRQLTPVLTLWPAPDATAAANSLVVWRRRHIMDVGTFQNDIEVPQRWYEALCYGLAFKLACSVETIDPQMMMINKELAKESFDIANAEERDDSPFMMAPDIGMYTA